MKIEHIGKQGCKTNNTFQMFLKQKQVMSLRVKMSLKKKRLQKNIAKLFLNGIMLKM